MTRNSIFLLLAFFIAACGSRDNEKSGSNSANVVIGTIDSLQSEVLNEPRKFWVHVPQNYNPQSNVKYPVVYLLDGDAHFTSVVGMINQLSTVNGNSICPQMIVVGIPNTDRTRDLTPSHVAVAFGDSTFVKTSGGGDRFLDFVEKELIPYVDKNYPTTPYRTFIGHSFGGLAVLHALISRPAVFANYVAIDPSLWWDKGLLLGRADSAFLDDRLKGKSLFVSVANTMPKQIEYTGVEQDTTEETFHIRSILKFAKATEARNGGLNFSWKYYPGDSHGSVPLISAYDALHFLFPWFELPDLEDKIFPEPTVPVEELVVFIEQHFKTVSDHFGYVVLPDEQMVNGLGYNFLQLKKPEYAFAMFDMNVRNYPLHANVYDSMGDYYLAQSDTVKAIEFFEKAVETGDLSYSKDKLSKLKKME